MVNLEGTADGKRSTAADTLLLLSLTIDTLKVKLVYRWNFKPGSLDSVYTGTVLAINRVPIPSQLEPNFSGFRSLIRSDAADLRNIVPANLDLQKLLFVAQAQV